MRTENKFGKKLPSFPAANSLIEELDESDI